MHYCRRDSHTTSRTAIYANITQTGRIWVYCSWFWVVLVGFGFVGGFGWFCWWFWVVLGRFGWFRVLVTTLSFIGFMIATSRSIETTMTIKIEAGADIWYKPRERICEKFLQNVRRSIYSLTLWTRTLNGITDIVTSRLVMAVLRIKILVILLPSILVNTRQMAMLFPADLRAIEAANMKLMMTWNGCT